ncbi:MAG: hypothetical protein NZL85_01035, partial [Fimbriimonadales bacterium]|nr:hypothetical protein [Fimbriimonadales bacterium]
ASANGTVVVGWSRGPSGIEAFRWTLEEGMQGLGELEHGSYDSRAYAISADGRLVGGFGTSAIGKEAVLWDPANGMRRVKEILLSHGLSEVTNWRLEEVRALSADGTVVVGTGENPSGRSEAWIAIIPRTDRHMADVDLSGCVDDADLLRVLFSFGDTGYFPPADLNYDTVVDDADLLMVLFSFGDGC